VARSQRNLRRWPTRRGPEGVESASAGSQGKADARRNKTGRGTHGKTHRPCAYREAIHPPPEQAPAPHPQAHSPTSTTTSRKRPLVAHPRRSAPRPSTLVSQGQNLTATPAQYALLRPGPSGTGAATRTSSSTATTTTTTQPRHVHALHHHPANLLARPLRRARVRTGAARARHARAPET